jgi:hypothetical protein
MVAQAIAVESDGWHMSLRPLSIQWLQVTVAHWVDAVDLSTANSSSEERSRRATEVFVQIVRMSCALW